MSSCTPPSVTHSTLCERGPAVPVLRLDAFEQSETKRLAGACCIGRFGRAAPLLQASWHLRFEEWTGTLLYYQWVRCTNTSDVIIVFVLLWAFRPVPGWFVSPVSHASAECRFDCGTGRRRRWFAPPLELGSPSPPGLPPWPRSLTPPLQHHLDIEICRERRPGWRPSRVRDGHCSLAPA